MTPTPIPALADTENGDLAPPPPRLYDTLMAEIEPDLLLQNLSGLDEKYAGEMPEAHDARMKRYEVAYAKFDQEFQMFMSNVSEEVHTSRREALKVKEEESKQQSDQPLLSSLRQPSVDLQSYKNSYPKPV